MAAIYSCETQNKEALGKEGASMYAARDALFFPSPANAILATLIVAEVYVPRKTSQFLEKNGVSEEILESGFAWNSAEIKAVSERTGSFETSEGCERRTLQFSTLPTGTFGGKIKGRPIRAPSTSWIGFTLCQHTEPCIRARTCRSRYEMGELFSSPKSPRPARLARPPNNCVEHRP